MWLAKSTRAKPEAEARRLVEEAGDELEAIKQAIAALDEPKAGETSTLPETSGEQAKPGRDRETLAGRLALLEAS